MNFKMKPETEEAIRRREIIGYLIVRCYGDKRTAGAAQLEDSLKLQPTEVLELMHRNALAMEIRENSNRLLRKTAPKLQTRLIQ